MLGWCVAGRFHGDVFEGYRGLRVGYWSGDGGSSLFAVSCEGHSMFALFSYLFLSTSSSFSASRYRAVMEMALHTSTRSIALTQRHMLRAGSASRKRQQASPEGHGGQQREDGDLKDSVLQAAAAPLTPASGLRGAGGPAGLGARRRRRAAVFPALPVKTQRFQLVEHGGFPSHHRRQNRRI